jgi:hypothetical protein
LHGLGWIREIQADVLRPVGPFRLIYEFQRACLIALPPSRSAAQLYGPEIHAKFVDSSATLKTESDLPHFYFNLPRLVSTVRLYKYFEQMDFKWRLREIR